MLPSPTAENLAEAGSSAPAAGPEEPGAQPRAQRANWPPFAQPRSRAASDPRGGEIIGEHTGLFHWTATTLPRNSTAPLLGERGIFAAGALRIPSPLVGAATTSPPAVYKHAWTSSA